MKCFTINLFRFRSFFTLPQLFILYKAQIYPSPEYGSYLGRGAFKHSPATLDAIQKKNY